MTRISTISYYTFSLGLCKTQLQLMYFLEHTFLDKLFLKQHLYQLFQSRQQPRVVDPDALPLACAISSYK